MALGFGPISTVPLSAQASLIAFFEATSFLYARPIGLVESLTTDPLKKLVFSVEITVIPLTGATVPTFGGEVVPLPNPPPQNHVLLLRDGVSAFLLHDGVSELLPRDLVGSMSLGSNQLVLNGAHSFVAGDTVIVEIGGEVNGDGLFGTMGVGGVLAATNTGSYYHSKDAPKSLVANVVSVNGEVLTLNANAQADTVNARVYLDSTAALNATLGVGVTTTWVAGKFAVSNYVGGDISNGVIQGAGKGLTKIYTARGTDRGGLTPTGSNYIIRDLTVIGNAGWDYFGLPAGDDFYIGVGVWCFNSINAEVNNVEIINVWKKSVWFEGGGANDAIDCDYYQDVTLKDYWAQWYFGASDAADCTFTRCHFTSPIHLSAGYEGFRSTGIQFLDCHSINGSISFNSTGNWLLEDFKFTSTPNSWLNDQAFSHINSAIDINSNIQPPSSDLELGGIVRNIDFRCQGFIDPTGNYIIGARINLYNPNIQFDGGIFRYPLIDNADFPGVVAFAEAIYGSNDATKPANCTANDLTVVSGSMPIWAPNISLWGPGAAATNCNAVNIYINGVRQ